MALIPLEKHEENGVKKEYTAVIKQENDGWIGWIEEVPGVKCQEHTREELLETLRVTLKEALEFNRENYTNSFKHINLVFNG